MSNDLLEACKSVVDQWVRLVNSGDAGNWDPEKDEHIINARRAIALAESSEIDPLDKVLRKEVERRCFDIAKRSIDFLEKQDWEKATLLVGIFTEAIKPTPEYALAFLTGWPRHRVENAIAKAKELGMIK